MRKNPNIPQRPSILKRQLLIGSLALLAISTGEFANIGYHKIKHINEEKELFSKPDIANHLEENKITPISVKLHSVQHDEKTPLQVAVDMHAKDLATVTGEISAQVGGQGNMREGMDIAIPLDQLNTPKSDHN